MAKTITVDFTRPVPLFPLGNTVLLPHAVQGLHVFEPRYRQMVDACLSEMKGGSLLTARPIAMATIDTDLPEVSRGVPMLRPAVCVGRSCSTSGFRMADTPSCCTECVARRSCPSRKWMASACTDRHGCGQWSPCRAARRACLKRVAC